MKMKLCDKQRFTFRARRHVRERAHVRSLILTAQGFELEIFLVSEDTHCSQIMFDRTGTF